MFHRFTSSLKHIAENPYLNLFIGVAFLYSGISETVYELKEVGHDFRIASHHGVILFAMLHILKTLPHFSEGVERIKKLGDEKKSEQRP